MEPKKTDIYNYFRKTIKELLQYKNLKILKIKKDVSDNDIEIIYQKFMNRLNLYISMLEKSKRLGYFSQSSNGDSIYGYVYSIMIAGLIGYCFDENVKRELVEYLIKSQSIDGLCYDCNILNYQYLIGDGWGARHFMPHYFIALKRVNLYTKYPLSYLVPFYVKKNILTLMDSLNWREPWKTSNFVMNIGIAMQYERDFLGNKVAEESVKIIQNWLVENIRKDCGMWGKGDIRKKSFRYEIVRGAYHLYSLLIYDNIDFPYKEKAIDLILSLQNKQGGFDFRINSSACEDIDCIEPLIRLSILVGDYKREEIKKCIKKSFYWVVQNQMEDGGCVFRIGEKFNYGHENAFSNINESNLFATWFRTLSICYMYDFLTRTEHSYVRIPGYEYPLNNVKEGGISE